MEYSQPDKPKGYYVYLLCDDARKIFYVGCGQGDRMYQHVRPSRLGKNNKRSKRITALLTAGKRVRFVVLREGMSRTEAYELERRKIEELGKANLTNVCRGGYGKVRHSPETIAKLRAKALTRRGWKHTPETIAKISRAMLGNHNGLLHSPPGLTSAP